MRDTGQLHLWFRELLFILNFYSLSLVQLRSFFLFQRLLVTKLSCIVFLYYTINSGGSALHNFSKVVNKPRRVNYENISWFLTDLFAWTLRSWMAVENLFYFPLSFVKAAVLKLDSFEMCYRSSEDEESYIRFIHIGWTVHSLCWRRLQCLRMELWYVEQTMLQRSEINSLLRALLFWRGISCSSMAKNGAQKRFMYQWTSPSLTTT